MITGLDNSITDSSYSFIGGQGCTINSNANYSFVWGLNGSVASGANSSVVFSDGTAVTGSGAAHAFVVRATGGYWFYSTTGSTGAFLGPGNTTWTNISDLRVKENIRDLSYGLNAVLAMKPLVYNYKGNSASQKAIGFIAQDMRNVVPEVVDVPKDPAEMMGIRYSERFSPRLSRT